MDFTIRNPFIHSKVVYIDQTILYGYTTEKTKCHLDDIREFCKEYGMECLIIPIADVYLENHLLNSTKINHLTIEER